MADNLLEMAERKLGPAGISALESSLGVPAGKGQSALHAGMATMIAGMLHKGTDRSGMGNMHNMVTGHSEMDLSSLGDVSKDPQRMSSLQESGGGMLNTIFGNKRDNITQAFSSSLGLKGGTGGNLLKVLAPATAAVLGQKVKSGNLDVGGLSSLLQKQKPFIKDKLPGGMLQEMGISNFDKLGEGAQVSSRGHAEPQVGQNPTEHRRDPQNPTEPKRDPENPTEPKRGFSFGKWFWPLLIALAALYALNMCARKDRMEEKPGEAIMEEKSVTTGEAAAPATPSQDITGQATDGNFASSFRGYLGNTARDPNREFPMNVQFAPDSAKVTNQSSPDVESLAKILQEHPGVTVAIEGHTSGDGDEAKNQQLSEQRAEAVRQMLVDRGIDGNRVTATGMGSAKPVTDGSTGQGTEKNSRVSVRVVSFE